MTDLVKELEFERSACASAYVRKPVKLRRVSALGFQFLSPVLALDPLTPSPTVRAVEDAAELRVVGWGQNP